MKKRIVVAFIAACITSAILAGTAITASAAQSNQKEIDAMTAWLNGLTLTPSAGNTVPANPATPAAVPNDLTAEELKALTDTMFELVNKEREKAGLALLERNSLLDDAAMIRAAEVRVVDFAGETPHTRPDGTSYRDLLDELGINGKRCGENITRAKANTQTAMDSWMNSEGHRKNILRENYGSIGIGVHQRADGSLDWIQIFMLK